MTPKDNALAIILGGGQGSRLFPLTAMRSKPAVPLAGKYRLIDIPVSNCLNSEIQRMYILTQFNSESLNRHIHRTYGFAVFQEGFISIVAAEQTPDNRSWFQGTADAVRQGWRHFEQWRARSHLILAGDHLYRMDYRAFLRQHEETGADVTVSVIACGEAEASGFGLLKLDGGGRIVEFAEKPTGDALEAMRVDTRLVGLDAGEAARRPYLASMGIYVFKPDVLRELLFRDQSQVDFGKQIIPSAIGSLDVRSFLFRGYWQDIGTIRTFFEANLDMAADLPRFNLYDPGSPIFTRPRFLPAAKVRDCRVRGSLIAEGSILNGSEITSSVVGIRSILAAGVRVERSILMGADYYDLDARDVASDGTPPLGIGEGSIISNAIVDKNVRIGRGVRIQNAEGRSTLDGALCTIRDGIVIVPKGTVVPDGTVI
jgi:glucose-1-phosphate adenylyltransferase